MKFLWAAVGLIAIQGCLLGANRLRPVPLVKPVPFDAVVIDIIPTVNALGNIEITFTFNPIEEVGITIWGFGELECTTTFGDTHTVVAEWANPDREYDGSGYDLGISIDQQLIETCTFRAYDSETTWANPRFE